MKQFLEKLSRKIGFTPNEGKIVLILVGAFLIGGVLKLSGITRRQDPVIDYTQSDAEFMEKSKAIQQVAPHVDSLSKPLYADDDSMETATVSNKKPPLPSTVIDINQATKDELMALPGIGEAMAERIIMYREEKGKFTTFDDLLNVRGIGKKKLKQMSPYIKVN